MKRITGIWQDPKGNLAAWGRLYLTLNQDAVVISSSQIAPRNVSFPLDQNGALRPGARCWGNDELAPAGTYYTCAVLAYGGGLIWGPVHLMLTGSDPINITSLIPMVTIPVAEQTPGGGGFLAGVMGGGSNTNALWLAAGSNISLVSSSNASGMTVWINCLGGSTVPGYSSSTWTLGMTNGPVIHDYQLELVAGSNITLQVAT
jgi:hypothetical protein